MSVSLHRISISSFLFLSPIYSVTAGGDVAAMVNNVVDGFQYTETQIGTASDFKAWIKDYMNAVVLKLRDKKKAKEDIQAFKATAPVSLNSSYLNSVMFNSS